MDAARKAGAGARASYLLVIWALVAAHLFGTGLARASVVAAVGRQQREFDYFALALQWPGTICSSTRHCCAANGCCRYALPPLRLSPSPSPSPPPPPSRSFGRFGVGVWFWHGRAPPLLYFILTPFVFIVPRRSEPLHTFTIHGLWPDYDDGTWPSCCRHTSFDMDKISPLKPTLDKYWPSLYCSSSSTCFSGKGPFWAHEWEKHGTCSSPVVQEELQNFSTALDLYFK